MTTPMTPAVFALGEVRFSKQFTRLDPELEADAVPIDEYVELAKIFGAEDGHKFVNGVLDKIARSVRMEEVAAGGRV